MQQLTLMVIFTWSLGIKRYQIICENFGSSHESKFVNY